MEIPSKEIQSIDNALYIEHQVQRIITEQEVNGVQYNIQRGRFYVMVLRERQEALYRKIRPHLSIEVRSPYDRPVAKPYLRDGRHATGVTKWYSEGEIPDIGGPFSRVEFGEPDLNQRGKLITQLLRLGWKPANYTDKGNPRLKVEGQPCKSLEKIDGTIGKLIAEWYTYRHREGQILGFEQIVRDDGRISASAITIGTPTFRFRHKGVVNIPRATSEFGRQMRSLFTVPKGTRMVGHDAAGLELRMLAHYLNNEDYTNTIIHGRQEDGTDTHTRTQRDTGLPSRDDAKTFIYAFIYGAGDGKIGAIINASRQQGKRIRLRYLKANPGLAELIENSQRAASRGYLLGLDGRKVTIRRDPRTGEIQTYKALNTLLQSAGAIVMKWAMVILDGWIQDYGLSSKKVIDMHDEAQYEVPLCDVDMHSTLAELSIIQAGKMLNLNVPLAADVSVGPDWSYTH